MNKTRLGRFGPMVREKGSSDASKVSDVENKVFGVHSELESTVLALKTSYKVRVSKLTRSNHTAFTVLERFGFN